MKVDGSGLVVAVGCSGSFTASCFLLSGGERIRRVAERKVELRGIGLALLWSTNSGQRALTPVGVLQTRVMRERIRERDY